MSFHFLTSDLKLIEGRSPSIFKSLHQFFLFKHVVDKKKRIDYCELRLLYYTLHHDNKRKFVHLIHSVHIMCCNLYMDGCFGDYLVFDSLLVHLISCL